ncbi:MAG: SHD1 domain-containing protein [Planctomycetota bacterium]
MLRFTQLALALLFTALIVSPANARKWKDATGRYSLEADLVGFDQDLVILQRENKELGSCRIDQLSKEDQAYLKTKEAYAIHDSNLGKLQTWTTASGIKVIGKIVDFAKRDVTVQSRRGRTYVGDKAYKNLPEVYRTMLLKVIQHFEGEALADEAALNRWVRSLRGDARTYTLEGVVMELENGDEYGVPFFLLSKQDQEVLMAGYDEWLANKKQEDQAAKAEEENSIRLQSQAAAYQQDQEMKRQVAVMRFNMEAIRTGLTSAWEVTLYPASGTVGYPMWVVTMGRNSEIATQNALRQNPGYFAGPVRKVSW